MRAPTGEAEDAEANREGGRTQALGEAVTALHRVLLYAPDDLAALFHLGVAFARLRRYDDAVYAWERVVNVNPNGPLAATARQHARSARDLARILQAGSEA